MIDWPYPRLCAHRGAGKLAPENTLAAFRLGCAHGYRMVEFDVKLSADGVAFLLHDATLDRTTNGHGRADAHTWRELSQLDAGSWHSKAYAGETLPTLAALARWALAHDVAVNVEIKPSPGRERETGAAIAQDVAALWRDARIAPLLSSFSHAALEAAAETVSMLPRAFLCDTFDDDTLPLAVDLGCVALDARHTLLTPDVIKRAKDAKLRILAWTVNDPTRANELRALGVDTLITNAIDAISPGG
ncbi:MAG TPA: glycerophosphodiester phosphodiesterase [Casimicrobiaceae bacterium]|nr:glycerophosphodiester phosphodiesterase [Casimicrobiaceae bacterium]